MLEHLARLRPEAVPQQLLVLLDIQIKARRDGCLRDLEGSTDPQYLLAHPDPRERECPQPQTTQVRRVQFSEKSPKSFVKPRLINTPQRGEVAPIPLAIESALARRSARARRRLRSRLSAPARRRPHRASRRGSAGI